MLFSIASLLPMIVCALWSILLAIDYREHGNRGAHGPLLLWSIVATCLYGGHAFYFHGEYRYLPLTDTLWQVCNLAVFPLYLRYIYYLTEGRTNRLMDRLIWLFPLLMGGATGVLYALMDEQQTRAFIESYLYHREPLALSGLPLANAWLHQINRVLFGLSVVVTLWVGIRKIRRYNRFLEMIYADTEDKELNHIERLLWLLVAMGFLAMASNLLGRHVFATCAQVLLVPSLLFSALLFLLAYTGYRQVFSFTDLSQAAVVLSREEEPFAPQTSARGAVDMKQLAQRIVTMLSEEQLYLLPNLKVGDVALRLNTNTRYVCRAINEHLNSSFSDLINKRRINHAQRLMADYPYLPIGDVAKQSGYASLTSFYRNWNRFVKRH